MKLTKQEINFLKRDGITTDADIKNYEESAKNIYIYLNGQRVTHREAKKDAAGKNLCGVLLMW